MEDIDHVAARVTMAAGLGGFSGGCIATYRGHNIPRVATNMAGSWAMAATACIGFQRLASVMGRKIFEKDEGTDGMILATHATGGICGGGVLGYLFLRRPLRGMVFTVPVMLMVGLAEISYQEKKRMDPGTLKTLKPTLAADGSRAT